MNKVLKSIEPIVENSEFVKIHQGNIGKFCKTYERKDPMNWMDYVPFDISELDDKDRLAFLFVFNSLSFCYWREPKWTINYKKEDYDGSFGMIACLARALDEGCKILDPNFLKNLTLRETFTILEGRGDIPLLEDRWKALRELGENVISRFGGEFENVVKQGDGHALELVDVITTNFPFFDDSHEYNGKKVYLNKRAQLLVSDIIHEFGRLKGMEYLTGCADYKIPQVLRRKLMLKYKKPLARLVDNKKIIPSGCIEELEIRANTVKAIELIKQGLLKKFPDITSKEINDHLWLEGQEKSSKDKPYHLTKTTDY